MLGGILILLLTGFLSFAIIDSFKRKYPGVDGLLLKRLFFYHILLSLAYYGYALSNPSDSRYYFIKVRDNYRGDEWFDFYGTSTTFIEFAGYPFIKHFFFSYEAIMALFSFLGFLGFIYFYVFLKENLRFKHSFAGFNLLTIFLFLPNLHFWSSSYGKGSIIFLGMGLFFFGLSAIRRRVILLIIGGVIIYHVRPHIMLIVLVSALIAFVFSSEKMNVMWRVLFLLGATLAFMFIYQDVLNLVGIDEEEFISQGLDLSHRAFELSKATSGVDITSYSLPMQVFTFLFRPLFVDSPGILGMIVSVENLFYLLLTIKVLFNLRAIRYLVTGPFLVKASFLSFITVTIALAQISGNLGLAIRQKSQIMILFLFVIIKFMDDEKLKQYYRQFVRDNKKNVTPAGIKT